MMGIGTRRGKMPLQRLSEPEEDAPASEATMTQSEWVVEMICTRPGGQGMQPEERRRFVEAVLLDRVLCGSSTDRETVQIAVELCRKFGRAILIGLQKTCEEMQDLPENDKRLFVCLARMDGVVESFVLSQQKTILATASVFRAQIGLTG